MQDNNKKTNFEKLAIVLKAVAHPTRLAIIDLLKQNDVLSVNKICKTLGCEQSIISHHLVKMKSSGILKSQKKGLNNYYSLIEIKILKAISILG